MTARAPALFCSAFSLQEGQGARVRAGAMRLNACSSSISPRERGRGEGSHLPGRALRVAREHGACVRLGKVPLFRAAAALHCHPEHREGSCLGASKGSGLRPNACSSSISTRERGRGEGAHLPGRALRVNACSCAVTRKIALFRVAAAARATFLSGKVAKAMHAAARAVLRTVPYAARRAPCPLSHPASRPSPARAIPARAPSACAAPGANSPIRGLEHARLALAPGCAARRWPTLPTATATSKATATAIARAQRACSGFALDIPPPSAAAGLRGRGPQGERVGRAHAPQAKDGHRRAPRRHADPRSGRCCRGSLSLATFFGWQSKVARAAAAARNREPCQALRKNHRSRAMRSARLRKSAPSPGAMRHPLPVGEGKCTRSLTRAMPRQCQGEHPPAQQRMNAHAQPRD